MKQKLAPFGVDYTWSERGRVRHGRTVWNGESQADAEQRFQRRTPWVKVVPAATTSLAVSAAP